MKDRSRITQNSGCIAFLLLLHASPVAGQSSALEPTFLTGPETEPLPLPRLAGPIDIDGRPDEPAWQDVPALPLTLYSPVFRGEPTQRTVIRVAYDDEYLYAAGWFYDTDPDGIRINSLYRDRWNGDDAFALYIDVFNDKRNAKWFGTTPAGMRFDLLVSDDGATTNGSWDTFWDARATVSDEGWFAEVRIPFSSLGFQDRDDRAVMGLTATRAVSRLNERVTFPAIDPRYGFRQPSVAREVVVEGVRSGLPIYATPYVLTGVSQTPLLPAGETRFRTERELRREAGLDLRFAPSSELTLDITANSDFAQVEADDEQVNLDRFSLFFPEVILTPTWNISPRIALEGEVQYTRLRFPTRNDGADIHLTRLRVRGALDAHASGNAFVQYNSTTGRLALNVRLRYSFSEGTDVWVLYDDGLDVERAADPDGVRPPLSTGRALVIKYTHTLALRTPGGS